MSEHLAMIRQYVKKGMFGAAQKFNSF